MIEHDLLVGDLESFKFVFTFLPLHIHIIYLGHWTTLVTPLDKFLEEMFLALRNYLYTAIVFISDKTSQTIFLGHFLSGCPEENSLYST